MKRSTVLLLLCLSAAFASGCTSTDDPDAGVLDSGLDDSAVMPDGSVPGSWQEAADEILAPYAEAGWVPGFSIAVWDDGEVELLGIGRVDPAIDSPPMPDTLYEIGSVTKTFTGALLALAVERGDVTLTRPMSDLVPSHVTVPTFPLAEPMLLEHFVTHRTGLTFDAPSSVVPDRAPGEPSLRAIDADALYADVNAATLLFPPGEGIQYSNFAAGWLGYELQRLASAASYEEVLRAQVTEPLGMLDTVVTPSAEQEPRLAPLLSAPDAPAPPLVLGALDGAGSLRSTAADLARWIDAHLEPPDGPLGDAIRATQEPLVELPPGAAASAFGMFWFHTPWIDGPVIQHQGVTDGGMAIVVLNPSARVGVAILTNSTPVPLDEFALALAHEVGGESWRSLGYSWVTATPAIEVASGTFEELEGSYRLGEVTLNLVVSDGRLYASFDGEDIVPKHYRLWPDAADEYHTRDVNVHARMVVEREGASVTGIRWRQDEDNLYTREPTP